MVIWQVCFFFLYFNKLMTHTHARTHARTRTHTHLNKKIICIGTFVYLGVFVWHISIINLFVCSFIRSVCLFLSICLSVLLGPFQSMVALNCHCMARVSKKNYTFLFIGRKTNIWFWTTWGWVNNDRNFIYGWTIPLNCRRVETHQVK